MVQPPLNVFAEKEEHAHLGVAARHDPPVELLLFGSIRGNQAGEHQGRFGILEQLRRWNLLIERVKNQRWQIPNRFLGVRRWCRHFPLWFLSAQLPQMISPFLANRKAQ